jgi:hypothetical protein
MVAYDSRRGSDGRKRLSDASSSALLDALREQRNAGNTPAPPLKDAITAAANEARDTAMEPEQLIVQLKQIAEHAGFPATMGDEQSSTIREWMVSACIEAYFGASSRRADEPL